MAIYLPPSYSSNVKKKYPVVYFLPGYYDLVKSWTQDGYIQGFKLKPSLDSLIYNKKIKEMIVVIPNGYNFLEGTFYVNSTVTGNWEDFIVKDVVNYVDENYRTLKNPESRAITGHSMGGSGALDLSMKYPEIFSVAYGLCSGIFAINGLEESPIIYSEKNIRDFLQLKDSLSLLSREDAHLGYINKIKNVHWIVRLMHAYGSAFAPNPNINAPYFDFPYTLMEDSLVLDKEIIVKWEKGFGNYEEKVKKYKDNLIQLKGYYLDFGNSDFFTYIISGNKYYHEILNKYEIPHTFIEHDGDHESRARFQIENSILPICDSLLVF